MPELFQNKRARVLVVGSDEPLLLTRKALLGREYDVEACNPGEEITILQTRAIDLILVCSSSGFEQGTETVLAVRAVCPKTPIVRLRSIGSPPIPFPVADRIVTVDFMPESWLKAVRELLVDVSGSKND